MTLVTTTNVVKYGIDSYTTVSSNEFTQLYACVSKTDLRVNSLRALITP